MFLLTQKQPAAANAELGRLPSAKACKNELKEEPIAQKAILEEGARKRERSAAQEEEEAREHLKINLKKSRQAQDKGLACT